MTQEVTGTSLACERLARSRERMRQVLQAGAPNPPADRSSLDWLEGLKRLPGFDIVLAALRTWWSQQPLRQASLNLAEVAKTALLPLAQRAPLSLAAGAAALGGLLVWLRPWRLLPASALIAALMPNVLGKMVTHLPLQTWLAGLAACSRSTASGADAPSQPSGP